MPSNVGDYGSLLVGVGAVGTLVQSLRNHRAVKQVKASVGEANGQTLTELTGHMLTLVEYMHTRNHDIINGQTATNMGLYIIGKQLEDIAGKLG